MNSLIFAREKWNGYSCQCFLVNYDFVSSREPWFSESFRLWKKEMFKSSWSLFLTKLSNFLETCHDVKFLYSRERQFVRSSCISVHRNTVFFLLVVDWKGGENGEDVEQRSSLDHWLSKSNKNVSFFHDRWNGYFVFRVRWKDLFIFLDMRSRPTLQSGQKVPFFKDPRPVSYPCQSKNSSLYIFFNSLSKKGFLLAYSILYNVCMH